MKINVKNKDFEYDIEFVENLDIRRYFSCHKTFLITNDNLAQLYGGIVDNFEHKVIIKDGEPHKTFDTYKYVINELLRQKIERKDLIIALGGGVTGDIAGFCAATVLRGVDVIQVPTTLLSMVDSSIGGKTGINTDFGKNLLGAFHQPKKVIIDTNFLKTLPDKEIKTGLGEIVKYAFIEKNCSKDKNLYIFNDLKSSFDYKNIIYKCASLKACVVENDEKESGLRAVLNFGHTFAHSIETITNYDKYTHGQAVTMGIKLAFELAYNRGLIEKSYFDEAVSIIDNLNIIKEHKFKCDKDKYIEIMKSDKKVLNSRIRLVLPIAKQTVKIFDDVSIDEIKRVI